MTIKQFIEKAIEGGWQPCDIIDDYNKIIITHTNGGVWIKNDPDEDGCHIDHTQMFLDPLAWQAVGKVMGWGEKKVEMTVSKRYGYRNGKKVHYPEVRRTRTYKNNRAYKQKMHAMLDALCEGKTIEEYLETL
jgi:hypothetical protein